MPVRGRRRLYLINTITVNVDDNPNATDGPGGTIRPIVVKMKKAVGDYFGLEPLLFNDPIFSGTFGGEGLNQGAEYRRRLGGFKDAAYKLIAETSFDLTEQIFAPDGSSTNENRSYRTLSIGFPKGHSVTEVIDWLASLTNFDQINSVVSPAGYKTDLYSGD
jgi:hypothetical protein